MAIRKCMYIAMTDLMRAACSRRDAQILPSISIFRLRSILLEWFEGTDLEINCHRFRAAANLHQILISFKSCTSSSAFITTGRRIYQTSIHIDRRHRHKVNCNPNSCHSFIFQVMLLARLPVCQIFNFAQSCLLLQTTRFFIFFTSFLFPKCRYDSLAVFGEKKRAPKSKLLRLINHCLRFVPSTGEKKAEMPKRFRINCIERIGQNFEVNANAAQSSAPNFLDNEQQNSSTILLLLILVSSRQKHSIGSFVLGFISRIRLLRWAILIFAIGSTEEQRTQPLEKVDSHTFILKMNNDAEESNRTFVLQFGR